MTDHAAVLGLLAAAVGLVDTNNYVSDTVRGEKRTQRGTLLN